MECIISRSSVINKCNEDGEFHLLFTDKEKPCEEAYLKELLDSDGNTKNLDFPEYTALILYDEEIKQED